MGTSLSASQAVRSGVNQTKVTAGSAFVGSCALTKDLVAQLLGKDAATHELDGVSELLAAHEAVTGNLHDFVSLCTVQKLLSTERHENTLARLKSRSSIRSQNLMMACSMPHASDWLRAPPVPGLGLGQSNVFRTALKFRLGIPLFDLPSVCPALSSGGSICGSEMDVFGDHGSVVTMVHHLCFATTTSGTFLVTQPELLVSQLS